MSIAKDTKRGTLLKPEAAKQRPCHPGSGPQTSASSLSLGIPAGLLNHLEYTPGETDGVEQELATQDEQGQWTLPGGTPTHGYGKMTGFGSLPTTPRGPQKLLNSSDSAIMFQMWRDWLKTPLLAVPLCSGKAQRGRKRPLRDLGSRDWTWGALNIGPR